MHKIKRPYSKADVKRLQGSWTIDHTVAREMALRLRELLSTEHHVKALGALTGNQAVQQVRAGLKAIYLSGWQVAADANTSGQTFPDQSLYPVDSVPTVVKRIVNALLRADQIEVAESKDGEPIYNGIDWLVPIVADAEAGFGGPLNVFELTKALIEAGAAAVHLEDQLSAEKKCGHLGGKVLIPTSQHIRSLVAARLAADVMNVPTVIIARTDAGSAQLLTSDIDPEDRKHVTYDPGRSPEGFYYLKSGLGLDHACRRGLAYAPYADVLWMETSHPDLNEAAVFADVIHQKFPGMPLAYNCSPSFNWKKHLSDDEIADFQDKLGEMGYKFQFVTLAGFHALNHSMFELAHSYNFTGMTAYSALQEREFKDEELGYTATKHQREVGVGYFDKVMETITGGQSSTMALKESTEAEQFTKSSS